MPLDKTINELRKRFKPEAAKDLTATYLFEVVGEGGGAWLARITKGNCEFTQVSEERDGADCVITVNAQDMEMILDGRLSAMTAAMSGLLTVDGEIGLAMQLVPIFFDSPAPYLM
jgi:putative sterol carrier protein